MPETTVRPSPLYKGCLQCETCGAHFNPAASTRLRYDFTNMGGGVSPVITRHPGQCLGCGRTWEEDR